MQVNDDVRAQLSGVAKRKIYSSTIVAVILVLTLGQLHAGFLILVVILPLLGWLSYSAFVIVKRPYARLGQSICVAIWICALALVAASHYIWHTKARDNANGVVLAITHFTKARGNCPRTLLEAGFRPDRLEQALGENYRYSCADGKPSFSYVATFTVFDTYAYDFREVNWKYESWAEKKLFLDTRPPGMKPRPE